MALIDLPPFREPLVDPRTFLLTPRWQPWMSRLRQVVQEIEAGDLSAYLALTGGTMSGAIAMGGNKITGLAAGGSAGDALRYEQLVGAYLALAGGTMAANIAMGGNKVTGLGAGSTAGDALRYEQLIGLYLLLAGGTMAGDIAFGGSYKLTGLAAGSSAGHSVRYEQLGGASATELGYSVGVTSGIQAQIDAITGLSLTVLEIGDWNMNADATKSVAHGLTLANIRFGAATIRNDADDTLFFLVAGTSGAGIEGHWGSSGAVDATNVNLRRGAGTTFDSTDFNATSYNRGWIGLWTA